MREQGVRPVPRRRGSRAVCGARQAGAIAPMLTLSLLRHAKSSWKDPTISDHDRPLNARGTAEAPVMGKAMAKHGLDPDLVLCSTARRTRDTLQLVLPELKTEPKIVYEDELYHASPAEMLDLLHGVGGGVNQVLLVGHNPELQSFASRSDRLRRQASQGSARGEAADGRPRRAALPGRRLEGHRHQQRQARAVPHAKRRESQS